MAPRSRVDAAGLTDGWMCVVRFRVSRYAPFIGDVYTDIFFLLDSHLLAYGVNDRAYDCYNED